MTTFRHLTSVQQMGREWMESEIFPFCEYLRDNNEGTSHLLKGRSMFCLFYEPSFMTRTSFERAIELLGGKAYHTEDATQFFPFGKPKYLDNIVNMLASLHFDLVLLRCSDDGALEGAEAANALPIINGGSFDDHPTQALADLYTLHRELGSIDGIKLAVVGRLEHRNVNALLRGLAIFDDVKITLIPFSGHVNEELISFCRDRGTTCVIEEDIEAVSDVDAIYLNGPRTLAHTQLLKTRNSFNLRIDEKFMSMLRPHCVLMDPMQRTGDFDIDVQDCRIAFYRQAENALLARMAVLYRMLSAPD